MIFDTRHRLLAIALASTCLAYSFAATAQTQRPLTFNRDIRPILSQNCFACHGPDTKQRKADLRLDDPAAAAKVIEAASGGDWKTSELYARITSTDPDKRMPPPDSNKSLSETEIATLSKWLEAGATYEKHWAFVKPKREKVPEIKNAAWPRNPVDYFVLAQLEAESIAPSPEAEKSTLVRRLYLDLIGLPPTPEQTQKFVMDSSPLAYERLVDELLASPHFGERWGRHWLDAARYADSNGYSIDGPREIWKYRDWVIDAYNKDMPFDEFTIEQLGGDLLPNATDATRIATGFQRNTLINQEGGIDEEEFRIAAVIDRVNTTGTVFLGLTVGCAQCHAHKYDPITHDEYYKLFAFFNSDNDDELDLATPEQAEAKKAYKARLSELSKAADDHFDAWYKTESDAWYASLPADVRGNLTSEQVVAVDTPRDKRSSKQLVVVRNIFEKQDAESQKLNQAIAEHKKTEPKIPHTMVLTKRKQPRETFLFIAGDFTRHGEKVSPGTFAALNAFHAPPEPTRLDLARWIVDPENPLTARVIVNRYWMHLFGRGIVETENDFGLQGTLPTHPELLDWLATEFVNLGWSTKTIVRKIVTSATYRQSSNVRQDLQEKDPDNRLLARQSRLRLDAEIIRDNALVASGQFNPSIGGPSVYPPQPEGVMTLGQSNRAWVTSNGPERFRRGMYTFFWRATPHPALTVFDATDATVACTRRNRSNTPLQALTLLNDPAFQELAQHLAARVLKESPADNTARLLTLVRVCLARDPQRRELEVLRKLLDTQTKLVLASAKPETAEAAVWTQLARTVMNTDEFITRE
jgi:cytochrome c553